MIDKGSFDENWLAATDFYQKRKIGKAVISVQSTGEQMKLILNNLTSERGNKKSVYSPLAYDKASNTIKRGVSDFAGISIKGKESIVKTIDAIVSMLAELRQQLAMEKEEENHEQH